MDISLFENVFAGVSKISPLKIEVWDSMGVVFSPVEPDENRPAQEVFHDLYARVSRSMASQHICLANRCDMYATPLRMQGQMVGVLMAYAFRDGGAHPSEIVRIPEASGCEDVKDFLIHLTGLIEEKWDSQNESEEMANELSRHFEDLHLYANLATQIKTLRFSNAMLGELIEEILETIRVDFAFSLLPARPEFNQYFLSEQSDKRLGEPRRFIDRLIQAVDAGENSPSEKYFVLNDSNDSPVFRAFHPEPYRFLAVMIQYDDHFYGWIGMVSFNFNEYFRRSELRLLISVAEQIAMVISNTDLYTDLERFVINMVKSLVFAIEAKDRYTRGHSERVNRYCMMLADHLGLDEIVKKNLNWASVLHDIGKIGIPEAILNKPGRLTDAEYDIVKQHPAKGAEILKPIEQLKPSLPGVFHHHEHYNGKGYPSGLKGEAIPLLARIIAVADTFDALTSSRAYRPGMSYEKGLAILNDVAGEQLDPRIVALFSEIIFKQRIDREQGGRHAFL